MHVARLLATVIFPVTAFAAPYANSGRLPRVLAPRQDNGTCDLKDTVQPQSTLQAPGADLSLVLIALGQGTQNYTCANSTASPAALGAVAQLFNASCAVANNQLGTINEDAAAIGMHFFLDSTTPDFDIIGLGNTELKKAEAVNAPSSADVPWLRLDAVVESTTGPVRKIYRLNTKGGIAPPDCAGQAPGATVTVDYQAQYWVYACTAELQARRMKRNLGLPLV